jgi:PE family
VSFVTAQPEALSGAAGNLAGLGDAMAARDGAAATPTTALTPAASDIVSAVHEQLVAALRSGAGAYALTEAANAAAAD